MLASDMSKEVDIAPETITKKKKKKKRKKSDQRWTGMLQKD